MIEITKKQILRDVSNDMSTFKTYLVYFKFYNETKTRFRKGHFVQTIEHNELFEYADKDFLTKKEQNEITHEIIFSTIEAYATNYNNPKQLFDFCNETIKDYNKYATNY